MKSFLLLAAVAVASAAAAAAAEIEDVDTVADVLTRLGQLGEKGSYFFDVDETLIVPESVALIDGLQLTDAFVEALGKSATPQFFARVRGAMESAYYAAAPALVEGSATLAMLKALRNAPSSLLVAITARSVDRPEDHAREQLAALDNLGIADLFTVIPAPSSSSRQNGEWPLPLPPECNATCKGLQAVVHGGVVFAGSCNKGCVIDAICGIVGCPAAGALTDDTLGKLLDARAWLEKSRPQLIEHGALLHYRAVAKQENPMAVVKQIAEVVSF